MQQETNGPSPEDMAFSRVVHAEGEDMGRLTEETADVIKNDLELWNKDLNEATTPEEREEIMKELEAWLDKVIINKIDLEVQIKTLEEMIPKLKDRRINPRGDHADRQTEHISRDGINDYLGQDRFGNNYDGSSERDYYRAMVGAIADAKRRSESLSGKTFIDAIEDVHNRAIVDDANRLGLDIGEKSPTDLDREIREKKIQLTLSELAKRADIDIEKISVPEESVRLIAEKVLTMYGEQLEKFEAQQKQQTIDYSAKIYEIDDGDLRKIATDGSSDGESLKKIKDALDILDGFREDTNPTK